MTDRLNYLRRDPTPETLVTDLVTDLCASAGITQVELRGEELHVTRTATLLATRLREIFG